MLSPRARTVGLAAAVICLLAPSTALAATLTVDPADANNTCTRGTDNTCKTIAQAIAAAQSGDTISILKGTYAESVSVPADKDDLILRGSGPGDVKITGSGTGDVVTLLGDNASLSAVTVETPANAASAVVLGAPGGTVDSAIVQRNNASSENEPVIDVPAAGAGTVSKALVVQNAGAAGTPAIRTAGTAGLTVLDAAVISTKGPAVAISASEANRLVRSTFLAAEPSSNAIHLTSSEGSTTNKKLQADSSVFVGGADGSGLAVITSGSDSGDVTIDLRHVTIAGAKGGIRLDATAAQASALVDPDPAGNITATATSSIIHGASTANRHAGALLPPTHANTVKLTYANCDGPPATGNGDVSAAKCNQNTEDAKLFVTGRPNLRPDAPVIDKGAAPAGDESTKDFEGDPRVAGAASDIGADEYLNKPPVARFGITNTNPRQNETIGFVSGAQDPEQGAGGGIAEFRWDFGDGTKQTTAIGAATHAYANSGVYNVTLTVVDRQGLASEVSPPQPVTVRDGVAPTVRITAPAQNARLTLNPKARKPRKGSKRKPRRPAPLPLSVLGTAVDDSGVQRVEISLRVLSRDDRKKRARLRGTCEFYSGRLIAKKSCARPIWVAAAISGEKWALTTRRGLRLPAGRYELRVRATDATGIMTGIPALQDATLVRFRVK